MLNQYSWQTIQQEGKRLNIPEHKQRALIREYLQSKIINSFYKQKKSQGLSFIGGTSLRILRGLDRFSEDLDFDNLNLTFSEIKEIFRKIEEELNKQGFKSVFNLKKTNHSGIGDFRFPNLLFELEISRHQGEKLKIKINYTTPEIKPVQETITLSRFGFTQIVITNTLPALLSQKIKAVLGRSEIQPRDFYDLVWFLSRNIEPDFEILKEKGLTQKKETGKKLIQVYQKKVLPQLKKMKLRLRPFLINESKVSHLDIFEQIVKDKWIN